MGEALPAVGRLLIHLSAMSENGAVETTIRCD
jgi:hypothetical protein